MSLVVPFTADSLGLMALMAFPLSCLCVADAVGIHTHGAAITPSAYTETEVIFRSTSHFIIKHSLIDERVSDVMDRPKFRTLHGSAGFATRCIAYDIWSSRVESSQSDGHL